MSDEAPTPTTTMLYREGAKANPEAWNEKLDTLIVPDDEIDAAKAEGWKTAADLTAKAKPDPKAKA